MVARCSICGKPAVAYVEYQRKYYCRDHFIEFIEGKVRRTIKRYRMINKGDRIVATISGGKDSATLLSILVKLGEELRFEVIGLHIDLGIGDYSGESREKAEELAKLLGVPLIIFDVSKELGYSVPEIAMRLRRPTCSVCGIIKRYLYNAFGVELRAKVATGHNADDIMSYALKNFLFQELEQIGKLAPVQEGIPGLAATRIRPLYSVYEKESFLYSLLKRLPFVERECPHARLNSLEFKLKDIINRLEDEWPTLKSGFLSMLAKRSKDYPVKAEKAVPCNVCGLLSSSGRCSFCRLTEKLNGVPMGGVVRRRVRELAGGFSG